MKRTNMMGLAAMLVIGMTALSCNGTTGNKSANQSDSTATAATNGIVYLDDAGDTLKGELISYTEKEYQEMESLNDEPSIGWIGTAKYNDKGQLTSYHLETCIDAIEDYDYTYNDAGQLVHKVHRNKVGKADEWFYQYEDKLLLNEVKKMYAYDGESLEGMDSIAYSYQNDKILTKENYTQTEEGDIVLESIETFTHKPDGSYTSVEEGNMDIGNVWTYTYEYDARHRMLSDAWKDHETDIYTYDNKSGLLTKVETKVSDEEDTYTIASTTYTYQYDDHGNWTEKTQKVTDEDGNITYTKWTRNFKYKK